MARTNYLEIGAVQFGVAKRLDRGAVQRQESVGAAMSPAAASLTLSGGTPIRQGSVAASPASATLQFTTYAPAPFATGGQRNLMISQGFTGGIYG